MYRPPLPEELTYQRAADELDVAREELERTEHGADDGTALHRYVAALRARNIAWREMRRARRAREDRAAAAQDADSKRMIVMLEGRALVQFHQLIRDLDDLITTGDVDTLRVMIDPEGVKAKPGRASWSPGYGELEGS
jgi:hypothetical protein